MTRDSGVHSSYTESAHMSTVTTHEESSASSAIVVPKNPIKTSSRTSSEIISTNFWVCAGPFFDTALLIYREGVLAGQAGASGEVGSQHFSVVGQSNSLVLLRFFDADGFLLNEVRMSPSGDSGSVVELDSLLGGCKFESGLKHARLEIQAHQSWKFLLRLYGRDSCSLVPAPREMTETKRAFFPITLAKDRLPLLCFINYSDVHAAVRGRLFFGTRTPETVWSIPPRGCRVVSLVNEFGDAVEIAPDEQAQAYVRLGVRGQYSVGVQLVERVQGPKEGSLYLAVS